MKNVLFNLLLILIICSSCQGQSEVSTSEKASAMTKLVSPKVKKEVAMEKIIIKTADGMEVTADKYANADENAKWIILCHQARFSRGEYIETALKFVAMGYSCLALDQRSGDAVNGVKNETNQRAVKKGMGTEYADALPDLEAALDYTKNVLGAKHIMMIGSSYSASLAIIMAAKYPDDLDAIACFSPGNYFKIDGQDVSDFAKAVNTPTFITSEKGEAEDWKEIFDNIPTKSKSFFLPKTNGFHGSKALWSQFEEHKVYWNGLQVFLKMHF